MKKTLITGLKGMIVGGTMLVPGVSGGSMAMILGIYDQLIMAVSSFRRAPGRNFRFLLMFSLGGGLGMLLFARPLLQLIEAYPMEMLYFFLGAVAGGVPLIYSQARTQAFTWRVPIYVLLGIGMVVLISFIPENLFQVGDTMEPGTYVLVVSAGLLAAAALILPGISISYFLLMLGLYDITMQAISSLYLPFLLSMGLGLILGILLLTKLLETAMKKYPQPTYLIILGFVLGSLGEVFPGIPALPQLPLCLLMLAAGFFIIRFLSQAETKE